MFILRQIRILFSVASSHRNDDRVRSLGPLVALTACLVLSLSLNLIRSNQEDLTVVTSLFFWLKIYFIFLYRILHGVHTSLHSSRAQIRQLDVHKSMFYAAFFIQPQYIMYFYRRHGPLLCARFFVNTTLY